LGLALPVVPLRRHLAVLEPPRALPAAHPVVWRLTDEVYFRPESGGVLASPCDELQWSANDAVATSSEQLAKLGELLPTVAAGLADARVRRAWAGLRSFAPDREFVVGSDVRAPGLFWIAGLGGRGVTCGLALGEVCANAVLGRPDPLLRVFDPSRLR
jgi:D-arginine dehydrogenase